MGFLDNIFGGSEKESPKKPKKAETPAVPAAVSTDIPAEHIAVIAAAIAAYTDATATVPATMPMIKIRRGLNPWVMAGRQEVMDARKF